MKRSIPVSWHEVSWHDVNRHGYQWLVQKTAWFLVVVALILPNTLSADERSSILVMGDSLSAAYNIERDAGWVTLLAERLGDEAEVINASISGETTSGGAQRLPALLRQHSPTMVLLELGGNDGLRGLSPQQMQANLARMIEQSQAAGAKVLLLGIDIPPNYGQAYRNAFKGVFTQLADTYDVPLVPFLLENIALNDRLMQDDDIHPTADAQPIILENVWPKLAPMLNASGTDVARAAQE
jgi:acyl-CoA thioesterase-1